MIVKKTDKIIYIFENYIWKVEFTSWKEEWPNRLKCCNLNQKASSSNPNRGSVRFMDPNSLWGSCWTSGQKYKNTVINIGWVSLSPQ